MQVYASGKLLTHKRRILVVGVNILTDKCVNKMGFSALKLHQTPRTEPFYFLFLISLASCLGERCFSVNI